MDTVLRALLLGLVLVTWPRAVLASDCEAGANAVSDRIAIAAARALVGRTCACGSFAGNRSGYLVCVRQALGDPSVAARSGLRPECRRQVASVLRRSTCGYPAGQDRHPCCEQGVHSRVSVKRASRCVDTPHVHRDVCLATDFTEDACNAAGRCRQTIVQATVLVPSAAEPPHTPGSPGVTVTNAKLLAQFGAGTFSLNNIPTTRWRAARSAGQPDAILLLVPGFEGGAGDFKILAENLIARAQASGLGLEVWGLDRRTHQLEDRWGLDIAEEFSSGAAGLDWLFGTELGLVQHPLLALDVVPPRRAVFYDEHADTAFMAEWTNLVFSRDIDAAVAAADAVVRNHNVFLGGHSAGTGFTARYAATDFNLSGVGAADPGYAKVRGLVLFEGGGGSTGGTPLTADALDRIEAKFDGGLLGAVRDNAPRCVDGLTPCAIASEAVDCAGQTPATCTPPATGFAVVPGLLNPRILASVEPSAIQGMIDPDGGRIITQADQGAMGNNAVAKVPDLATLAALPAATVMGGIGSFIDDDGVVASIASFVATAVGAPGPTVGGLQTWLDVTEGPMPASAVPNNGPAPTTLPGGKWGQEKEVTRFDRMLETFFRGGTNFTDWYYPSAGPSTTTSPGYCATGVCAAGKVGAACAQDADCAQSVNLDSSALSVGRGRRDIENLTQAANIDIPVFAVGGSNGLVTVPGGYTPFASSIGTCTAPSCTGAPRVVDAGTPSAAFPTFGGVAGGFEVVVAEGFAHVDVLTAEDDAQNPILAPLTAFLVRNAQ
ncbi:MAG: hypothetical protein U0807_16370 [Candidatus Binatia bacterium]